MRSAFIAGFLALQIAVPVSYYLGDTPLDERFAWRMFSPIRVRPCRVAVYEGDSSTPLSLTRDYHIVWHELLARARPGVVRAIADDRCRRMALAGVKPRVRMVFDCALPGAPAWRPVDPAQNLCEGGP